MLDLSDKVALVTGASGAIGSAISRVLHSQGAFVIMVGTKVVNLEKLSAELKNRNMAISCDLSNNDDVKALVPSIEDKLKRGIDILVNNAGITDDGLLLRMSDESWERVLNLNLEVPFKLMKTCVKSMMKNHWGRIINISSIVGIVGNIGQSNYCASKAGLIGVSKALAKEVATRDITVNCVAPGFIDSPMVNKIPEKIKEEMLKSIPMRRTGSPKDVANCVAFLASEEAAYVTGQTLHVNGGMAMI